MIGGCKVMQFIVEMLYYHFIKWLCYKIIEKLSSFVKLITGTTLQKLMVVGRYFALK